MKESTKKGSKRHNMHNDTEYKTRNILTLEQRIAVLREYDKKPVYQALATKFKCSAKQIKTIIANRKKIEREMQKKITSMQVNASSVSTPTDTATTTTLGIAPQTTGLATETTTNITDANNPQSIQMSQNKREEKINFMNKVIYEYMQRATFQKRQLDTLMMLEMADQVKEAIAIEFFRPNKNWLKNFMETHKLKYFDMKELTERFNFMGRKELSLRCYDIIEYVRLQEQGDLVANSPNENQLDTNSIKIEDDDDQNSGLDDLVLQPQHEVKTSAPIPEVSNVPEAINYLKVLQDYALLQENFRAIGLLTQLEEVIKNPPSLQDFE